MYVEPESVKQKLWVLDEAQHLQKSESQVTMVGEQSNFLEKMLMSAYLRRGVVHQILSPLTLRCMLLAHRPVLQCLLYSSTNHSKLKGRSSAKQQWPR